MELILIKDVENVGRKGDVIRVRDGYGRNFLIPRRLGVPTARAGREFVEAQKERTAAKQAKEKAEALARSEKLSKLKVKLEVQAGEKDKLFGSVTAEDVREALKREGYAVEKKQIHLRESSIRSLGAHEVDVEIYPQVKATVTVEVIRKS